MCFEYILFSSSTAVPRIASLHSSAVTMASPEAVSVTIARNIAKLQEGIVTLSSHSPAATMASPEAVRATGARNMARLHQVQEGIEILKRENLCLRDTLHQVRQRHADDLRVAWRRCAICTTLQQGSHPAAASSTDNTTTGYVLGPPAGAAAQAIVEPQFDLPPQPLEDPPDLPQHREPGQVRIQGLAQMPCVLPPPPHYDHPDGPQQMEPCQISQIRYRRLAPCRRADCDRLENEDGLAMEFPGYCCWRCKNEPHFIPMWGHGKCCQKKKQGYLKAPRP